MSHNRNTLLVLLALLLSVFWLAACGGEAVVQEVATEVAVEAETPEQEVIEEEEIPLTEVSLRLPWLLTTQFAGPYVALEKGYFTEEGLDVTINPGGFDVNPITLVAARTETFGLHDMGSLILARAQDIPLVSVATYFQKHPGAVMALASSGIETLEDLEGKTVGFQEGGPWLLTQAMLEANGIDPASLTQTTVGFDLTPLYTGQVDLFTVYATNEPLLAAAQGHEPVVFLPYDYGIETSSEALFTRADYLEQNPEVVCGMARAIRRGWEYSLANPEEAVDIILAAGGEGDREAELAQLEAQVAHIITEDTEQFGIGYMTEARWQAAEDVLAQYGQLEVDVDITSVFDMMCIGE
jgi:NitT/TauT family transport system substrate-binding protein